MKTADTALLSLKTTAKAYQDAANMYAVLNKEEYTPSNECSGL